MQVINMLFKRQLTDGRRTSSVQRALLYKLSPALFSGAMSLWQPSARHCLLNYRLLQRADAHLTRSGWRTAGSAAA